jgi:hypothetical protein
LGFPQARCGWFVGAADGAKDPSKPILSYTLDPHKNAQFKLLILKDLFPVEIS